MEEPEALDRIGRMTASATEPVLDAGDLEALLDVAKVKDVNGVEPDATGWVPTYAFNTAAAEGWDWKAGRASERINWSADGRSISASQLYDHCIKQRDYYRQRAIDAGEEGNGTEMEMFCLSLEC